MVLSPRKLGLLAAAYEEHCASAIPRTAAWLCARARSIPPSEGSPQDRTLIHLTIDGLIDLTDFLTHYDEVMRQLNVARPEQERISHATTQ